jgi:hypothetical protein
MKTLKFLTVFYIIALLSLGNATAQQKKVGGSEIWPGPQTDWPCIDEALLGDVYFVWWQIPDESTGWVKKIQYRIKGTLIGEKSGAVYILSDTENYNNKNTGNPLTWNEDNVINVTVIKDGVLVASLHFKYHVTYNWEIWEKTGGPVTFKQTDWEWVCY